VFYKGTAYRRILTGDHKINEAEVEAQEEFKEEAVHALELQLVPGLTEANLDLTKLNQFIFQLNQPVQVETMKPDLVQARPFQERRCFVKDGGVTVLGALVCAQHPGDCLGLRCGMRAKVPRVESSSSMPFTEKCAMPSISCRRAALSRRKRERGVIC
jgi:hypothetical protein